jgi:serine/threonine-protein kinase HipA
MADDIGVWLFDQRVGTLSLVGGRLRFQYSPEALAQPVALALSQSLPLGPEPFDDHQCRAFFAGLLPEGNLRRLIARQCQVSSWNDFALLNAIGGECAGAITFLSGRSTATGGQAGIEWLDEPQLMALLDEFIDFEPDLDAAVLRDIRDALGGLFPSLVLLRWAMEPDVEAAAPTYRQLLAAQ